MSEDEASTEEPPRRSRAHTALVPARGHLTEHNMWRCDGQTQSVSYHIIHTPNRTQQEM